MTPLATVLIPTHDHGPLLYFAVRSALAQTVQELEIFIIGDGVPDVTHRLVADLMLQDNRVGFFDHPKGPRNGEAYRSLALAHARGEVVCYLGDDDLWLPDHIETMDLLLKDADFTHALPLSIAADGAIGGWTVDLALVADRELHLGGSNRIPLCCGAHTLRMYRRLPYGWRTTPDGIWTDLYMWQQFLAHPDCRAVSGTRPTVLHFPRPWRTSWTTQERVAELECWTQKIEDPGWRGRFASEVLDWVVRDRAGQLAAARASQDGLRKERDRLCTELDRFAAERDRLCT